ncbi:DNA-formamidopyrimidine glycosylase [Atopobacter phocae]|uniref:DNA-formamidopyrimidine glycosylase n=1 Tax=Atopobacter phocae TaxID=136492 RepID=UPI00046FC8FA|nr:DNA-formamidopyrimidine glycosylase [Atopobacter phocae]
MPELPEVETVRRGLVELVKEATIVGVSIYWERIITPPFSSEKFAKTLMNQTIHDVLRRGKYLIFLLDDWAIISHLRMEGKYQVVDTDAPHAKHTHVIFHLADGRDLRYLDVRKFGRMTLVPLPSMPEFFIQKHLGPEPLTECFKLDDFRAALNQSQRMLKPFLLDQRAVVGIGNIYCDEVLFDAQLHPQTLTNCVTATEAERLFDSIRRILKEAVERKGSTIRTYKNTMGEAGTFQELLKVYQRAGQPCVRCQTPIQKIKVAQRGTHYCPTCQIEHSTVNE